MATPSTSNKQRAATSGRDPIGQMAAEALAAVPSVSPAEARQRIAQNLILSDAVKFGRRILL
ncbi:MAG: hypothetical protein FJZ89_05670 [Chloroflexi bacterium]|nr:hypothetical protein [Chloroflexota bacterium]